MKEKIYTIPVNEAFESDCECPICFMKNKLESDAIAYTMGPSYMEDDIREKMNELGFCKTHLKAVYDCENRLGFALVMKTHMDKVISDLEKMSIQPVKGKALFGKIEAPSVYEYTSKLENTCFVCDKINNTFARYIDTVIYLYKKDDGFVEKYNNCKGLCTSHYGELIKIAASKLSGEKKDKFVEDTNKLYLENMKRVRDDVEWFINKFDHKYASEPWKNAKDCLPRAMIKASSAIPCEVVKIK